MGPLPVLLAVASSVARAAWITLVPVALWAVLVPGAAQVVGTIRQPLAGDASSTVSGVANAPTDRSAQYGARLAPSPMPPVSIPIWAGTAASTAAALPSEQAAAATTSLQALPPTVVSRSAPPAARWVHSGLTPVPTAPATLPTVVNRSGAPAARWVHSGATPVPMTARATPSSAPARALVNPESGSQPVQAPLMAAAMPLTLVGILVGVGLGLATYATVLWLRDPQPGMATAEAAEKPPRGRTAWPVGGDTSPRVMASSGVVDGWAGQYPRSGERSEPREEGPRLFLIK